MKNNYLMARSGFFGVPAIKIFYENSIPGLYGRICTGLSTKL